MNLVYGLFNKWDHKKHVQLASHTALNEQMKNNLKVYYHKIRKILIFLTKKKEKIAIDRYSKCSIEINRIRTKASIRNSRIRIEMTQGFYHIACVHVLKIFCCVFPFNNDDVNTQKSGSN